MTLLGSFFMSFTRSSASYERSENNISLAFLNLNKVIPTILLPQPKSRRLSKKSILLATELIKKSEVAVGWNTLWDF